MGKGDKKTKRGKIVLGSYGVRRRRKKSFKPVAGAEIVTKEKETKGSKHQTEKKHPASSPEVKETRQVRAKTPRTVREKKEVPEDSALKEAKPKKEKKA